MPSPAAAYGSLFIGFLFKTMLQGVLMTQGYIYYTRFRSDRLFIKIVIGLLIFADTLDVALNAALLFDALITHFGCPSAASPIHIPH
ncbi:hypothetical protein HGRIS_005366 [Hohenbuehelia grisea]|uniref:Uncharacterized protein n=1 Tax=Hohenbuehelia grisea TaxID=104357 RepID=A0ABR3JFP9_9AGAR